MRDHLRICIDGLVRDAGKCDDLAERLAKRAKALQDVLESLPGEAIAVPTASLTKEARRLLAVAARSGVTSLAMDWDVDGSAMVSIGHGEPFRLQPKLAALLAIIATPGGRPDDDGLIGWRSYDEVGTLLEKRTGHPAARGNVTRTIHHLKIVLRRCGQNPELVQADHRGAIRFALRASCATAHGSAPRVT